MPLKTEPCSLPPTPLLWRASALFSLVLAGCATQAPPPAPPAPVAPAAPAAAARPVVPPSAAPAAAPTPEPAASEAVAQPVRPAASAPQAEALTPIEVPIAVLDVPGSVPYAQRPDVQAWAEALATRTGLPIEFVRAALGEAKYLPSVGKLILPAPSGTPKNWAAYRARFVEPKRIQFGAAFWRDNEKWLTQAEQQYGVPAEIVVGLIGVETLYGQHTGRVRTLDALATLGFDFPPDAPRNRSPFFRNELEQFFLLVRDIRANPVEIYGSYAGALGLPQFMPSSWRRYAVDFDGDGRIDLQRSVADAIGSVAHYLTEFGWQRGQPVYFPVSALPTDAATLERLLGPDILPSFQPAELAQAGVGLPPEALNHPGLLALVKLENGANPPSYVLGTDNFYAITRYNQSSPYAMAVTDLGQAIGKAR